MALKRCTSTEHLWNRKLASLASPVLSEIFLLRSVRSWRADVLKTPRVSMAIGSNIYRPSRSAYFTSLREAASSAAAPDSRAAALIYDSANYYYYQNSERTIPLLNRYDTLTDETIPIPIPIPIPRLTSRLKTGVKFYYAIDYSVDTAQSSHLLNRDQQ